MTNISYKDVVTILLKQIPELQSLYDAECPMWVPNVPHPHVVYGSVLPELIDKTEAKWRVERLPEDKELLDRIFNHVESLVVSTNFETRCVVQASLLETLLGDARGWDRYRKFFKTHSTKMAVEVMNLFSGEN